MKTVTVLGIAFIILIIVLIVGVAFPIIVKNGLIDKNAQVQESWAQIDTQLLRRADLIPNLVNTVKGYAKHEKEIFADVSNARARLIGAASPSAKADASGALNSALGRLLAIAENYPALKADNTFIRLQDELAGTENRISVARTRYNTAVKIYNAAILKFPGSLFASGMQMKEAEYFKIPEGRNVEGPPEVNFE